MKNKPPNTSGELRSHEIHDIVSAIPSKLVRCGSMLLLAIIVSIVVGLKFIVYPDILPAEVSITTPSPPVKIVAGTNGELRSILVMNNQHVDKDEVLAVIDNTARYEDVVALKMSLRNPFAIDLDHLSTLMLGEISNSASKYFDSRKRMEFFLALGYYKAQFGTLTQQLKEYEVLKVQQFAQRDLILRNIALAKIDFARTQKLFEGTYLSAEQFETKERDFIDTRKELTQINQNITSTNLLILESQKDINEIDLRAKDEQQKLEQLIDQSLKELKVSILEWEKKYLLTSPISGMLTFLNHWSEGLYVQQGEEIFVAEPKFSTPIGNAQLPLQRSAKVKVGQHVQIRLDNYPFEEYGLLQGRVGSISSVPRDQYYLIAIEFPDGLVTSYNLQLEFHQQMHGVASIITEDMSLFDRIFNRFEKLFSSR